MSRAYCRAFAFANARQFTYTIHMESALTTAQEGRQRAGMTLIPHKPPKPKSSSVGVNLPDTMWARLEKLADFRGRSRNELIRMLLDLSLPKAEEEAEAERKRAYPDMGTTAIDLEKRLDTVQKRTSRK